MHITDEEILAWYKIYVLDRGTFSDMHTSFMNAIGTMCRATAKQKAYMIAYDVDRSKIMEAYKGNK